ncbi:MAG TPA: serine/threonine-protein kinase [Candidatus Bilamarchaeum sp.]|nr:serine/threonine-protein kinase [Candidatus Bilamarchaeum sp.]
MKALMEGPESQRTLDFKARLKLQADPFVEELRRKNELIHARYRIEGKVGGGGMGNIYLAHDEQEGGFVAVKMVAEDIRGRPDVKERYFLEAEAAMKIDHPNVIEILDIGESGNRTFIVMEFLEGMDLKARIAERAREGKALSWDEVRHVIDKICDALDAAHGHGIIHRDLKPENIFLVSNGDLPHIKLIDFGLVKFSEESERKLTKELKVGTPTYAAPEQIWAEKYDHRADLYSLAVVIYEALTGIPPFVSNAKEENARMYQVLIKHKDEKPRRLTETRPGLVLPKGVEDAIMKALEKDPEKRFQSALEMKAAILGKEASSTRVRLSGRPPDSKGSIVPSSRPAPAREKSASIADLEEFAASLPNVPASPPSRQVTMEISEVEEVEAPAKKKSPQPQKIPDEAEEPLDPDKLRFIPEGNARFPFGKLIKGTIALALAGAAVYFGYENRKRVDDFMEPQRAAPQIVTQDAAPVPTVQAPATFQLRISARSGSEEVRGASVYDITGGRNTRHRQYLGSTPLDVYAPVGERRILIVARGFAETTLTVSPQAATQTVQLRRPRSRPSEPQLEEPPIEEEGQE